MFYFRKDIDLIKKKSNSQSFLPQNLAMIGCGFWFLWLKCFAQKPRKFAQTCSSRTLGPARGSCLANSYHVTCIAFHVIGIGIGIDQLISCNLYCFSGHLPPKKAGIKFCWPWLSSFLFVKYPESWTFFPFSISQLISYNLQAPHFHCNKNPIEKTLMKPNICLSIHCIVLNSVAYSRYLP